ncbi:MAG: hypothetical protein U0Q21_06230 [Dermatophilaceae bacterium]
MTAVPLVDRAWRDAFVGTMRLGGAGADMIGARLAEVEAHCRDSGESATEAFGPAEAYARSLAATLGRPATSRSRVFGLGMAMFVLGYPVVALAGLTGDEPAGPRFPWRLGAVVGLALFAGTVVVLPTLRMRGLSGRAAAWILLPAIGFAVALSWAVPRTLFTTARVPTVLGFIALLLGAAGLLGTLSWRAIPRDPVTGRTQPRDRALALLFPLIVLMPTLSAIDRFRP